MWLAVQFWMVAGMYLAEPWWSDPRLFIGFVFCWYSLDLLLTVAALPISMRLCDPKVAATQFLDLHGGEQFRAFPFGAFMLGKTDAMGGAFLDLSCGRGGIAVALVLLLTVRYPRRPEFYARQAEAALVFDTAAPLPGERTRRVIRQQA